MVNEITITAGISVTNGNLVFPANTVTAQHDQSVVGGPVPGMKEVGTSEEQIQFTELTDPGWFMMKNLDTVNKVRWGFSTGVYGGELGPGETAGPFKLDSAASIFAIALVAPCRVDFIAFEK